jgi:hypothetical protein
VKFVSRLSKSALHDLYFISASDLSASLRDFRHQTQHYATDRDDQIRKASRALEHIDNARVPRAQAADIQKKVEVLYEGLAALRRDNDKSPSFLLSLA